MEPTTSTRRIALWDVDPACVFVPDYHEIERRLAREAPREAVAIWLIGAALTAAAFAVAHVKARVRARTRTAGRHRATRARSLAGTR